MMIRNNKWKMLISSIVILLPLAAGLLLWDKLPTQMVTHWGLNGAPDKLGGRTAVVFAVPLSMLALHWLCVTVTGADPGNKNQTKKITGLIFWICPFISLYVSAMLYASAFGMDFGIDVLSPAALGLMLAVIGNYLPKCKQNYTIGIRVKWALENEENWNATHRFGGKVWFMGGLLLMLCVFLPKSATTLWIVLLLLLVMAPVIYSYVYYRRQKKAGTAVSVPMDPGMRRVRACVLIAILLITGFLMFSGNIRVRYGETSFTVNATYHSGLTVDYAGIESIEYREQDTAGVRTSGFGTPRLLLGAFRNDEYGHYTRYTYTLCKPCVVLTVDGKTLVLNGADPESTRDIYNELVKRTGL